MLEILPGLQYKEVKKNKVEIRCGEPGWDFYIILSGSASVWIPIENEKMIKFIESWVKPKDEG